MIGAHVFGKTLQQTFRRPAYLATIVGIPAVLMLIFGAVFPAGEALEPESSAFESSAADPIATIPTITDVTPLVPVVETPVQIPVQTPVQSPVPTPETPVREPTDWWSQWSGWSGQGSEPVEEPEEPESTGWTGWSGWQRGSSDRWGGR